MEMNTAMKTRIAAAAAVVILGIAAPVSSAMAFGRSYAPVERVAPVSPYDDLTTGSIGSGGGPAYAATYGACPMSSASEGNAAQQNRLVKQYGQTSGGYRC